MMRASHGFVVLFGDAILPRVWSSECRDAESASAFAESKRACARGIAIVPCDDTPDQHRGIQEVRADLLRQLASAQ